MSFSTIFKRIPSFGRRARPDFSLPSVESDEPSENYLTAPNSFFEQSVESIPAQTNNTGPCAAQQCARAGQCCSSDSEGEAEEGQCVFSYDEPTSSIFYVSNVAEVTSVDGLSSLTSFSSGSEGL